jgi:intracellular sulfur oxidation DsrE/DsrF family protein
MNRNQTMTDSNSLHPRRRFLGSAATVLAGLGLGLPAVARADHVLSDDSIHDEWMKSLKGKHRQIFHATVAADSAMLMANNFLDAYSEAFEAKPGEVNVVIGIHSGALSIGFNDAAWAKYSFGKSSSVTDPATKEAAVKNIFARDGRLSVEESQKRGVVFLMCNTALRLRSRALATERGEPYETVYADLNASRLPGTVLVPALVVALNRAQEAGFTYVRV